MISNKNGILHCKCGGIGYYRAVVVKHQEVATTIELITISTLMTKPKAEETTTPKPVDDTTKIIFYDKPLKNISSEELKLMGNSTVTSTNSGM